MLIVAPYVHATTTLTYEYDANGNLIQGDGKYYEHNDANQLIRVRHGDASGPVLAEYFYDYTGQRIKKVENGITTYYIGKHYEKQTSDAGSANASYYFANGERVAKRDSLGNISYYHLDHLGGTNVVTDSSGNLLERIKYYPFGEIREGGNEKYSFTGKEKDELTDFYYFEARYYNPEFKHFTKADMVAPNLYDPQDLNRYAYVRNNPMKLVDPSGHFWKELFSLAYGIKKAISSVNLFLNVEKLISEVIGEKQTINTVHNNPKVNGKNDSANITGQNNKNNRDISRVNNVAATEGTKAKEIVNTGLEITRGLSSKYVPSNLFLAPLNVLSGGQFQKQVDKGIESITNTDEYKNVDPKSGTQTMEQAMDELLYCNDCQ